MIWLPALTAGLATLQANLPFLQGALSPIPWVLLSIGTSAALAALRASTTKPLAEHKPKPAQEADDGDDPSFI